MNSLPISLLCLILSAAPVTRRAPPRPPARAAGEFIPSIPKDTLPPWRYVEMTRAIFEDSSAWMPADVEDVELLAWYAKVDDRPLYVNVALFGARLTGGRWALVQMGQNPIPEPYYPTGTFEIRTRWHAYTIFDVDWKPIAVYPAKPTSQQVEAFLRWWDDTGGWQTLTQGFRAQTWKAFLGLPAPRKLEALNAGRSH